MKTKTQLVLISVVVFFLITICTQCKQNPGNGKTDDSDSLPVSYEAVSDDPFDIKVISWNVESGGSHNDTIASQICLLGEYDFWGFSEVQNQAAAQLFNNAIQSATGQNFEYVMSESGGGDRLMIAYNSDAYDPLNSYELDSMNIGGRVRAPLVGHFRHKASHTELLFMVNHLYRSNATARQQQAAMLNDWMNLQDVPVIAVGDYNFDYDIDDNQGNTSYELFIEPQEVVWIEPANKIQTYCSDEYNSILDFIFVNDDALAWKASSSIIVKPCDCQQEEYYSDHRPVTATFRVGEEETGGIINVQIRSVLPNPVGTDRGNEEITLINHSEALVNIDGWIIRDKAGNDITLSGQIIPGEWLVIRLQNNEVPLNNDGDELFLINNDGEQMDHEIYIRNDVEEGGEIVF